MPRALGGPLALPLCRPSLTVEAQEALEVRDLQRAEGLVVVAVEPGGRKGEEELSQVGGTVRRVGVPQGGTARAPAQRVAAPGTARRRQGRPVAELLDQLVGFSTPP